MSRATKQSGSTVKESKGSGRSTRMSKDESDEKVDDVVKLNSKDEKHLIEVDVDASDDAGEMEQPTVTSWASEITTVGKPTASRDIIKLDQVEAEKINKQTVESTSINDLLRVLIKRGYDGSNPALAKGGERLLLQLNCIPTSTYRDDSRGGGGRFGNNPQGGRGSGGSGGRGQFNGRDRDDRGDRNGGFNRQNNQGGYGRGGPNNGYGRSNDQGPYNGGYGRGRGYNNQRDEYGDNQRNRYGNSGGDSTTDQIDVPVVGSQNGTMRTFDNRRPGFNNKPIGLSSFGQFGGAKPTYNSDDRADNTQ